MNTKVLPNSRPRIWLVLAAAYVLAYPLAGHPLRPVQQNIPPSAFLKKINFTFLSSYFPLQSNSTTVDYLLDNFDLFYPRSLARVRLPTLSTAINPTKRTLPCSSALLLQLNLTCTNLLALTRRSCTASMYLVFNRLLVLSRCIRGGVRC